LTTISNNEHQLYMQLVLTHWINAWNNFAAIANIKLENRKCLD